MTVTDSAFSGNMASVIINDGTASVNNTTFTNNSASVGAGGIRNLPGSMTLTVSNSTFSNNSGDAGVLLKVQDSNVPQAGAISVVYDALAQAVRVSTFRLGSQTWTPYANTTATFANGDKLTGCVTATGNVRIYKNNTPVATVVLTAADQTFFNGKGGKAGVWAIAASNALLDDFGGGTVAPLPQRRCPSAVAANGQYQRRRNWQLIEV